MKLLALIGLCGAVIAAPNPSLAASPPPENVLVLHLADAKRIRPPFVVTRDPTAARDTAVAVPGKAGRSRGTLALPFDLPKGGIYSLWLRAYWGTDKLDACSNSITFQLDERFPITAQDGTYRTWHWVQIRMPGTHQGAVNLKAGRHILIFTNREDGIKIDQLLLAPWHKDEVKRYSPIHERGPVIMSDDFARETLGKEDAWLASSGTWRTLFDQRKGASPNPSVCKGSARQKAGLMLSVHVFSDDLTLSAAVSPHGYPEVGLVVGYRDTNTYDRAVLTKHAGNSFVSLISRQAGADTVVARRPLLYPANRWSRLEIRQLKENPFLVLLDGVEVLSGPERSNPGKAGLFVRAGTALFDDFRASSEPPGTTDELPLVAAKSTMYSLKRRYTKDNRDDQLFRWARDLDAWAPLRVTHKNQQYTGRYFRLPLLGDFDFRCPGTITGGLLVLRDWLGNPVRNVPFPADGKAILRRRDGKLSLNGRQLGASAPGDALLAGVAVRNKRNTLECEVRSGTILQELFEDAAVGWLPVDGEWQNTYRWKCDPEWTFFSGFGYDSVVSFSKRRFTGNQVHELYFGMKDVFDRQYQRRRYARHDVGFSFMSNGKDLFSGFTFIYGGFDNTASYLYRGKTCVATNKGIKFAVFNRADIKHAIFDEHFFWRRFRFEAVGKRVRVFLEDDLIFDYLEEGEMPSGGHLALWTYRNGVSYGRLNSSAEHIVLDAAKYVLDPPGRSDLSWRALSPTRVRVEAADKGRLKVTNRLSGGEFAVRYNHPPNPVDLREKPVLSLWADISRTVRVNLHVSVNGKPFILPLTAPMDETYRVLGDHLVFDVRPRWKMLVSQALRFPYTAGIPRESIRGEYRIDLLEEMKKRLPDARTYQLEGLIVGNTSHKNYLMAGFSGNAAGASYILGEPVFEAR